MKYQAYPEYEDSSVEWFGKVPSSWKRAKIKYATNKIGSGKTPKGGSEIYTDEGVTFLRSQNIYDDGLRLEDVVYISASIDSEMKSSRVEYGDILLNITGASIGRTCIFDKEIKANVNQHVCILRPRSLIDNNFFSQVLKSYEIKQQIFALQAPSNREGLNFEQAGNLSYIVPSISEQTAIANFLDREIQKIDNLISKQEKLIELLKEKRQAVISHAVTKGINPDVKMKDSGVEWLGEIPEHWRVTKAKFLFDFVTSGSRGWAKYYSDDGDLFFRISNLTRDTVDIDQRDLRYVTPPSGSEGERSRIKIGDLLISITADLGSV